MRKYYFILIFIIDCAAMSYLMYKGLTWWESMLVVLIPALLNFIDGLIRGAKYE